MSSPSFFASLGLPPIINAAGRLTVLGASTQSDFVRAAMGAAAEQYVDIETLFDLADQHIAAATAAEAGFITSCSAAGIAIAVAACITHGERALVEQVPFLPPTLPRQVIIQKGHVVHFGAEITQMIRIGGGQVVEVGTVNRVLEHHLQAAFNDQTAALLFVVSHHGGSALSLEKTLALAQARGVPVIVDAAAELDLHKYIAAGADLVIYSGHKAFLAPTSGIMAGKRALIDACRMQNLGLGRTMKIGKENIVGCLAALHAYQTETPPPVTDEIDALEARLAGVAGVHTTRSTDATRPEIQRLRVEVVGMAAAQLAQRLAAHTPSIRTRAATAAAIEIDFRPLAPGQAQTIAEAIREIAKEGTKQP